MYSIAPSCSHLLLFQLDGESINDLTIMLLTVQTGVLNVDQQFLALKRELRGLSESGQRVPNPTILPNFPLLDSNSKAALGATHTREGQEMKLLPLSSGATC